MIFGDIWSGFSSETIATCSPPPTLAKGSTLEPLRARLCGKLSTIYFRLFGLSILRQDPMLRDAPSDSSSCSSPTNAVTPLARILKSIEMTLKIKLVETRILTFFNPPCRMMNEILIDAWGIFSINNGRKLAIA